MANHGYVTSKKHFKKEEVLAHLKEINNRRFKSLLKIEDSQWGDNDSWFISYQEPGKDYPTGFNIWIASKKKLEHRHTHGWAFYLEIVFSSELGAIYDGKISDDCCDEKWDPEPNKYSSFKEYISIRYSHVNKRLADPIIKIEMLTVPKLFKDC